MHPLIVGEAFPDYRPNDISIWVHMMDSEKREYKVPVESEVAFGWLTHHSLLGHFRRPLSS